MPKGWQVGIDVGGTFTDVIAVHRARGEVRAAKVPSRTDDRIAGLVSALGAVDLAWPEVDDLIHGTTIVTNAIIQNDHADVALIATRGFADTLAIGRQNRRHLYRLDLPPKLAPQVPAERRFEVSERLAHDGRVMTALDPASVEDAIAGVEASGAEAVAVSLLHSYANPAHEEALGARLRATFPYVALSHRVNPEAREYERTATTVLSAGVMPLAAAYMDDLESAKPETSRLHLFHSAGGMASPEALRDLPLGLAASGPAAGVAAAGGMARALGIERAISFDMGGTTTDVCLILDGEAQIASDRSLGGRPLRQPMVAVESIGAGGGSVARLDHGSLVVGPESAGAVPGPACYAKGGDRPTVTDANLVLGYMDVERVLGGNVRLNASLARAAMAPLSQAMEMTPEAAALGVVKVADAAMLRALRRVTVERGVDGRNCTLLAFGGAGPMHAVALARAFSIDKVVVPAHSSMFSALGCVGAEMSYAQQRTLRVAAGAWDQARVDLARRELRATLAAPLAAAGHEDNALAVEEVASVRYSGQSYAIEIADAALDDPAALGRAFKDRHGVLYGFATEEPWELVSIRMRVSVPRNGEAPTTAAKTNEAPSPTRTLPATFESGELVSTPRYDRAGLGPGNALEGPVIVDDAWSTVVVPPGATLTADDAGHLHIATGAGP
ncbi:MAG: hydantoinase/oxoprolinase family protein [Rhodospirillales bacterium]|nr:hydantoinase/oxoprolinase family protein [Rhodospirillales bacterium]